MKDFLVLNACDASGQPVAGTYPDLESTVPVQSDPVIRRALDGRTPYAVDDLAHIVQEGMGNRQAAAQQAEAIIEVQVQNFMDWMSTRVLAAVPEVPPRMRTL